MISAQCAYASDAVMQYQYKGETWRCDVEYVAFQSVDNRYEIGAAKNCARADRWSEKCDDGTENPMCGHYDPPLYSISNGDNPVAFGIANYHPDFWTTLTYVVEVAVMVNVEDQTMLYINVMD